ncbi:small acid-soluble spore protein P [Scopulibacillus darangshiensis]
MPNKDKKSNQPKPLSGSKKAKQRQMSRQKHGEGS